MAQSREPAIIGPTADKVASFVLGFVGNFTSAIAASAETVF